MIEKIAQLLVNWSIRAKAIAPEDQELYLYGYGAFVSYAITLITFLVLGAVFHEALGLLIFLLFFYPLRIYSGGFHADDYWKCYLLSVLSVIAVLTAAKFSQFIPWPMIVVLLFISGVVIFLKAPVESVNKPLTSEEHKKYRTTARQCYGIEGIVIICGLIFNFPFKYIVYAVSAFAVVSILLCVPEKAQKPSQSTGE